MAKSIKQRLLSRIRKEKGCWIWTGSRFKKHHGDYAQIRMGGTPGKLYRAHRVAYELFVGPIPEGLEIDHKCKNTLCINPKHLEAVSHTENMRRRKDSGLSHCRYGHEYTPENTRWHAGNGRRECQKCRLARAKKSYLKNRQI